MERREGEKAGGKEERKEGKKKEGEKEEKRGKKMRIFFRPPNLTY